MKRFFDIIASVLILSLFLPFFLILSILIKLDSKGPVFFMQTRVGKKGKEFKIFKFRSMHINTGSNLTSGNKDSRITKMGQYIRRFHLDEFAQTINVLKGEMSIVGHRPELPEFVRYYPNSWKYILLNKPGITGLAAIKYAESEYNILSNSLDKELTYINAVLPIKLKYELFYTRKQSFKFDLLIIIWTIKKFTGLWS